MKCVSPLSAWLFYCSLECFQVQLSKCDDFFVEWTLCWQYLSQWGQHGIKIFRQKKKQNKTKTKQNKTKQTNDNNNYCSIHSCIRLMVWNWQGHLSMLRYILSILYFLNGDYFVHFRIVWLSRDTFLIQFV